MIPADQATVTCYYLFSKTKEDEQFPYRSDTLVLDIGSRLSRFYDPARLSRDSVVAARLKDLTENAQDINSLEVRKDGRAKDLSDLPGTVSSSSDQGESSRLYKNRVTNHVSVIDHFRTNDQNWTAGTDLFYEDDIGKLPWQLENVTDTILGYTCQKARLQFRGRDYTAWFTADIPISDGPWKFMGLPGLILKVEDSRQLFSFTLIGLRQLPAPVAIAIDKKGAVQCSRADFEKLKKKQGTGLQFNKTGGHVILSAVPGSFDYIPMEIE